jgi:WhiB family redox-sensing transcriptional regulator
VLDVIAAMRRAAPWMDEAACRDSDIEFVMDPEHGRESATAVVPALEVCAVCPVRAECLAFAYSGPIETYGVFGGSTMMERRHAVGLKINWRADSWHDARPVIAAAIAELDRTFPDRLVAWRSELAEHDKRLDAAYAEKAAAAALAGLPPPPRGHRRARGHGRRAEGRIRRVDQLLAEREQSLKRFHLGGSGGPGRGHRGPIATLAAELGCSRSTAWRKLRPSVHPDAENALEPPAEARKGHHTVVTHPKAAADG